MYKTILYYRHQVFKAQYAAINQVNIIQKITLFAFELFPSTDGVYSLIYDKKFQFYYPHFHTFSVVHTKRNPETKQGAPCRY